MGKIVFVCFIFSLLSTQNLIAQTQSFNSDFYPEIIGGDEAEEGEFPFQVSMRSERDGHFCGGVLIAPSWILTAAHCTQGWKPTHTLVIGTNYRKKTEGAEVFTALKVLDHPKYSILTQENDIALIQLDKASSFKPIQMNETEISIPVVQRLTATVSGWGLTKEGKWELPKKLQKVDVPLVTQTECNAPEAYNGKITENMLCAGFANGGKDSCQCDSGGPLFLKNENRDFLLIGIVSFGEGCGRPHKYGVYTKLNRYIDWIENEMSKP